MKVVNKLVYFIVVLHICLGVLSNSMDNGVLSKTSAYIVRLPLSQDEFMSPELLMNDDVTFKAG